MLISVIIPTLNEAENIEILLNYLKDLEKNLELIVADGYSSDNTAGLAKKYSRVIFSDHGRGRQMNAGAKKASGEILWFLHADCRPHKNSVAAIQKTMENPNLVGGGFLYNFNSPGWIFRFSEFMSNRKNHLLNLLYGDMGIFVRRDIFVKIGGYKEIPLMEDMEFCGDLKRQGEIVLLPFKIKTSTRRWHEEGVYKNMVRNWMLQIAWKWGVSSEKLARFYKFGNNSK